ncbi:glycosyltransferase [Actinomycetaceae bacterium L2_0104]
MESHTSLVRERVLAVLVTRADDPHLERVLRGIQSQDLAPARLTIAVTGGDDAAVRERVREFGAPGTEGSPSVVAVPSAATFSEAVNAVLDGEEPWIWLLHGDGAPQPSCLDHQFRLANSSSKIGAVGAKQVGWEDRRDLLEVGIRATRSARRIPEIEPDELDQGQLDRRQDVLAVGSVAMLVRREALDAVGGLDPALGPFGDGLETSRRLWAGGWRVLVEPRAVVAHARSSLSAPTHLTFARRRSAQLYNSVLAAPLLLAPILWLGYIVAGPVRALGRLITKDARHVLPELAGAGSFAMKLPALVRARRRLSGASRVSGSVLRTLEESPMEVWRAKRQLRRSQEEALAMANMPGPLVLRERAERRRATRNWAVATFAIAVAISVVGLLPLIGRGVLAGGALLPDASGFRDIAAMASSGWLPSGDGVAAPIDALWLVLSPLVLISAPLGGSLGAVSSTIVMLALPLAAMVSYWAAGRLTTSAPLRWATALLWAFAPPLLGAVSAGHVASIIWHILAPALVARALDTWRSPSLRAVGGCSLIFGVMSAAAPMTLIATLPIVVGAIVRRAWRWLWIPVPALVLLAPTILAAARLPQGWKILFATPGDSIAHEPTALGLASLSPVSTASFADLSDLNVLLPLLATALVVLLAALSLMRGRRRAWILGGWIVFAAGMAWAVLCSFAGVSTVLSVPDLRVATAWTGMALSLAALGLWLCLVNAGHGMRAQLRQHGLGWRQLGASAVAVCFVLGVFGQAGVWAFQSLKGETGMLAGAPSNPVPAVAIPEQQGDARSRVLELVPSDDGIRAYILRGPGSQLHERSMAVGLMDLSAQRTEFGDARQEIASAIADLAGTSDGSAAVFGNHAISLVFVPAGDDENAVARKVALSELNGAGGLEFVTENSTGAFWRVRTGSAQVDAASTSRLRIEEDQQTLSLPSGRIGARIDLPAGGEGRTLVLAERSGQGWHATLDGEELRSVENDWRQAWELPTQGGELVIQHGTSVPWVLIGQFLAMAVALILALPTRRRKQVWA